MSYCRKCGKKLGEGDRFCPECGTPVVPLKSQHKSDEEPGRSTEAVGRKPKKWVPAVCVAAAVAVVGIAGVLAVNILSGSRDKSGTSGQRAASEEQQKTDNSGENAKEEDDLKEKIPEINVEVIPAEGELQDYEKPIYQAFMAAAESDAGSIAQAVCPPDVMEQKYSGSESGSWETIGEYMQMLGQYWCYEFYYSETDSDNIDIVVTLGDSEQADEDTLESLGEIYEEYGADYLEIEEARSVQAELSVDGTSEAGTFTVIKYKGEWYMHPRTIY